MLNWVEGRVFTSIVKNVLTPVLDLSKKISEGRLVILHVSTVPQMYYSSAIVLISDNNLCIVQQFDHLCLLPDRA